MRVLVTGATGFIGSHLVDMLVERGDEVRVLVRPGEDNTIIRSRLSSSDIQRTNSTDPALGPPDIAIRTNSDQMRSQTSTTGWGITYFLLI